MTPAENRATLSLHIARLENLMTTQPDLPPEAQVTGLAALVNARTALHATDALTSFRRTAERELAKPLTTALNQFAAKAEQLTKALRRMPGK